MCILIFYKVENREPA